MFDDILGKRETELISEKIGVKGEKEAEDKINKSSYQKVNQPLNWNSVGGVATGKISQNKAPDPVPPYKPDPNTPPSPATPPSPPDPIDDDGEDDDGYIADDDGEDIFDTDDDDIEEEKCSCDGSGSCDNCDCS